MHARALLHFSGRCQKLQANIDPARLPKFSRRRQHHAALQRHMFDSREIHRCSLARSCAFHQFSAGLYAAHAQPFAARKEFHFVARAHASGNERARHHGTEPFHRERAVNRQPEVPPRVIPLYLGGGVSQRLLQFGEACPCFRADRHDRRALQERCTQEILCFQPRQFQTFEVH